MTVNMQQTMAGPAAAFPPPRFRPVGPGSPKSGRHGASAAAFQMPCLYGVTARHARGGGARRLCSRSARRPAAAASATFPSSESPRGPVDGDAVDIYTPYTYVGYSATKSEVAASVTVDAPADKCFDLWYDRNNHFKFLTLAEQIAYDGDESKDAIYMLFYRYAKLPTLQMLSEIERTEVIPGELIRFKNTQDEIEGVYMLPVEGEVAFAASGGSTEVSLSLSYGTPNLLKDEVGEAAVKLNVREILEDNMARFKALAEGS